VYYVVICGLNWHKLAPCGTDRRSTPDTKTRTNIKNPTQSNLDIVP